MNKILTSIGNGVFFKVEVGKVALGNPIGGQWNKYRKWIDYQYSFPM